MKVEIIKNKNNTYTITITEATDTCTVACDTLLDVIEYLKNNNL